MLPNLILIGFMGCGKSSVGRRLSTLTGHRLIDSDEQIVQAEGRSIAKIFAAEGEGYFRQVEKQVLESLIGLAGIILSTGGGLVVPPENRLILRKIGIVGWLDAEPDILFERASRSGKRPLLKTENPRETFDTLRESRMEAYSDAADFRFDSSGLSHDVVARGLLEEAQRHLHRFEG